MNFAEHPIAIDIDNRLAEARAAQGSAPGGSDDVFIAATVIFPGMPQLMGEVRKSAPGLYTVTSNVKLGDTGQAGRVDFTFTADKPVTILYPSAHEVSEQSRIVAPH